ncbi:putative transcriptional regulator [Dethiosulfovibrio peptidovorans DSM 11002]|uniref:Transcriptional regulator n=1 Tax=Dethiosulfovibrio peptidovorans DSM 11002 TaxID=469381 RepID=D2Z4Q5_9BACT|nr:crosslink repair DNA glycosylase YcaQ family protein [Dethiosulfovibrio peptidovorans]EFC92399.1 putative transcriptional regulator [Dethiosulfovibrio peptidovorans DSM 11002]
MDTNEHEIGKLIQQGESLELEFKSDSKCLPDRDLVAAVVSLANTDGGDLLLGVEDDGTVTGLHANHLNVTGIPSLIANKTNPAISVRVERCDLKGKTIARIIVPKSRQLVSTSEGLLVKRRLKLDGTPEAVPFYPHEFIQRQSSMGIVDPSAMVLEQIDLCQLDPLQRLRIRNAIKKYGGDQSLLALADEELDGALGLCREVGGARRPTITGLLLLGTEELLRENLPSYEVAFQVLQGTDVKVNEFYHKPLLETFEEVELLFRARVEEEEIHVGLFRVPVPNYDRRAFREAFVNALVHRDFSRLGAVHVKITDDGLSISNPGGFVEGVTLNNLLVADPRSRNPLLADVIKRIGLAERTGRGIDRIYEGMLRYGRSAPDYSMSNEFTVVVQLVDTAADLDFLKMVVEQEEKLENMPIDSLIILSRLREERRLTTADLAPSVQKTEANVRATLEKLVETGFLEPHGVGRGRTYTLSATVYQKAGKKSEYIRQAGFAPIQQEQMVLNYIATHGSIKRADATDLCRISPFQATRLLKRMVKNSLISPIGQGRGTRYVQK